MQRLNSVKRQGETPHSLTATRALPESARATWRQTLIYQQIEDLNASFDHLGEGGGAIRKVAAIAGRIVRGARLVRATAIAAAWTFAKEELDRPEDAFGPAVLLLALDGESGQVRAWADALPARVTRRLNELAEAAPDLRVHPDRRSAILRPDGESPQEGRPDIGGAPE